MTMLINSGIDRDFSEVIHNGEILPIDPPHLHSDKDAPRPVCFIYPPRLVGGIPGRKMPMQKPFGAVEVKRDPGDTSWSAGPGNVVRRGEVIGRIIRDPRFGWRLIDLVGHTMEYGMRHHDVAGAAHWRLPSAAEQAAYLSELSRISAVGINMMAAE